MANTPPDRAKDPKRQVGPGMGDPQFALKQVRGGSVCNKDDPGGHLLQGSGQAAVCMPTVSLNDPRPRWGQAGKIGNHRPSRHSLSYKQHRS